MNRSGMSWARRTELQVDPEPAVLPPQLVWNELRHTWPLANPHKRREQSWLMLRADTAPNSAPVVLLPRHSRRAWLVSEEKFRPWFTNSLFIQISEPTDAAHASNWHQQSKGSNGTRCFQQAENKRTAIKQAEPYLFLPRPSMCQHNKETLVSFYHIDADGC